MSEDAIATYAALKRQILDLEEKLSSLKPAVIDALRLCSEHRTVIDDFDVLLTQSTYWNFSPSIVKMQEALRDAKQAEKKAGIATIRERREIVIVRKHAAASRRQSPVRAKSSGLPARVGDKWTAEEEEFVRNEYHQGRSIDDIAKVVERKPGGVGARLIKLGLIEDPRTTKTPAALSAGSY